MMRWVLAAAALCGLVGAGYAAYLEGEGEEAQQAAPPIVRPMPPRPVPPPAGDDALTRAIRRITVRAGQAHKGLTVFTLETSAVEDEADYVSAAEALKKGDLTIREKGGGEVPALAARNEGSREVLLLAGQVLLGGKQNRVLREDVLLPADSGWVTLPVLCVEQRRWSGRDAGFADASSVAALKVRAGAQTGAPQQEVWHEVTAYQTRLNIISATGDLQDVQASVRVRAEVEDYAEAFADCWRPDTVGMVVAQHGRIVGADIFCNPVVFRKHRRRLLESYVVDWVAVRHAPRARERVVPPRLSLREAERFLGRAVRAHHARQETPGLGWRIVVEGADVSGGGLVHRGVLLHAALFAGEGATVPMGLPREGPELIE
ncbi:MAG: hypothetical protein AMK73_03505 [Planctomycetes bacterium SM23_32]|nr:MAG: hypothetical protein AMK73_03505 [Planctomycetes bacterium SM23_32]